MSWPLSQDFNEAVQNPRIAFSDPELKSGRVTTGPMGLPLPRSGNYADVYQVTAGNGSVWAVKCFTRATSEGLAARYSAITEHLKQAQLPFSVGFTLLPEGIRIRNQWYPIVKMQWVEGLPINQFVKDSLGRATLLENMLGLWVRLCRRMRETGMAHCDIQHGNVLLVPSEGGKHSLGLKLVDYDGMYVPALKNKPSGELGHASYQHPERVRTKAYSPDLDRFPHLVVVTALRALLVGGEALWEKYDTGDNLLFTERDFLQPGKSALIRELWDTGDAFTVGLLAHLILSCGKPLSQTPWVDNLMPGGQPPILTPSQERQAAEILGISMPVAMSAPAAAPATSVTPEEPQPPVATPPPVPVRVAQVVPPAMPTVPRPHPISTAQTPLPAAFSRMPDPPVVVQSSKKSLIIALLVGTTTFVTIVIGVFLYAQRSALPVAENPTDSQPAATADAVTPPVPETAIAPAPQEYRQFWSIRPEEKGVAPVARFSRDGQLVFFVPAGRAIVHAHDAANGKHRASLTNLNGDVAVLAPLTDSRVLVAGSDLVLWNPLSDSAESLTLASLSRPITAIRSEKSGKIAIVAARQKLTVVDLVEPKDLLTLEMPSANYLAAALSDDGSQVLTVTPTNQLRRTSVRGGLSNEMPLKVEGVLAIVAIDPHNQRMLVRNGEKDVLSGSVTVVDSNSGLALHSIPGQFALPAAFSRDGKQIYLISKDGLEVYEPGTGLRQRTIFVKGAEGARDLDVSPDGKRVLISCGDGEIRLVPLTEGPLTPLVSTLPLPLAKAPPPRPARPEMAELPGRETKRLPIPDAAAQQRADFEIKELFKADFARKSASDRRKLADKLMKDASVTKDATDRYMMLVEAKKIASELNEYPLMLRCMDLLEEFAVESTQERQDIFDRISTTVTKVAELRIMAEIAVEQADLFLESDDYESGLKLLGYAGPWFSRSNAPLMHRDLQAREAQVRKQKEAFDAAKPALEQFKKDPYDPRANLILGRFRCFVQGRWNEGMKHLELSDDPKLTALAKIEKEVDPSDYERGEAWEQYAKEAAEEDRSGARSRAQYWYGRALVTTRGLDRNKAEEKLVYKVGNSEYRPGILMEIFSLQGGSPRKRQGKLESIIDATASNYRGIGPVVEIRWTGQIKAPAPGKYRLIAETYDMLKISMNMNGEERAIIDIKGGAKTYPETNVLLSEQGRNITIVYRAYTDARHSIVLKWVKPGSREPEVIPMSAFYWSNADRGKITEK